MIVTKPAFLGVWKWRGGEPNTNNTLWNQAKNYIYAIEDFIGAKVSSISTSPERDDTILIEDPFKI